MAIDAGRPRLRQDESDRYRFVPLAGHGPVPAMWREVVDQTSVFARHRFPGGPKGATRWCSRVVAELPLGMDALVLVTVEELAVNELREPCHQWVRTIALPVHSGRLGAPLPHRPPTDWHVEGATALVDAVQDVWDNVEDQIKELVTNLQKTRTSELSSRLVAAGKRVEAAERQRFDRRRKELEVAMRENQLVKLEKGIAKYVERRQQYLFAELDDEERRRLTDLQAELELRRKHYDSVLLRLAEEENRTLNHALPPRYRLRGEARVYPIAIEIRVRSGRVS